MSLLIELKTCLTLCQEHILRSKAGVTNRRTMVNVIENYYTFMDHFYRRSFSSLYGSRSVVQETPTIAWYLANHMCIPISAALDSSDIFIHNLLSPRPPKWGLKAFCTSCSPCSSSRMNPKSVRILVLFYMIFFSEFCWGEIVYFQKFTLIPYFDHNYEHPA